MTRLIDADNFKDEMRYVCDAGGWLEPVTKAVTEYVIKQIDAQPTVDAIPIEWIKEYIRTHPASTDIYFKWMIDEWKAEQEKHECQEEALMNQ